MSNWRLSSVQRVRLTSAQHVVNSLTSPAPCKHTRKFTTQSQSLHHLIHLKPQQIDLQGAAWQRCHAL
jgi:hypothetical protein